MEKRINKELAYTELEALKKIKEISGEVEYLFQKIEEVPLDIEMNRSQLINYGSREEQLEQLYDAIKDEVDSIRRILLHFEL